MSPLVWDLIVAGAGPAGCAAAARALQLNPRARVLLLDKAIFPRDKTCGDGIAGAAIHQLDALGLPAATLTDGYEPVNGFRIESPGGVRVARAMPEPVWVIPRAIFDARVLDTVLDRGAHLLRHRVRTIEVLADRVVIDDALQARVVIGADGAESTVRRAMGQLPNPTKSLAIAIRGYGPELPGQDGAQLITMSTRHWPAYAWSFPIGGGQANLGYGQLLADGPASKSQLRHGLSVLLPAAQPDPASLRAHRLPVSTTRPTVRNGRVLLAGDAHSLINPLTGEGIYYAVVSGGLAGEAAGHGLQAGRAYRIALRRRLGRYLRHGSALARLSRWPVLMDAALRGAAANQSTFNDLVRLGLQDGIITADLVRAIATPRNWRSRDSAIVTASN